MHNLLAILVSPLLLLQGIMVRYRTPILPEPEGQRFGEQGDGNEIRLLIVGDSAGAGVGVATQQQALSGRTAEVLSKSLKVIWRLHAKTGATTASTLSSLMKLPEQKYDIVVLSLGVNDITSGIKITTWCQQQQQLFDVIQQRFKADHIICSGIPPMHGFPALPQPLRWYLGNRATQFDIALQSMLKQMPHCHYLNLRFSSDINLMASDGFHPGAQVYQYWGKAVAEMILQLGKTTEKTHLPIA